MGVGEIDFVNIWRRPTLLTYAVTIRRLLLRTLQWLLASLWVRFKVLTHLTTIPFILQPLQCPSPAGPCCYNTGFVSSSCACLQPQDVCSSDSSAWCYVLPDTIRLSCSSCSAAQSCLTLCTPMDSSTPGFLVHHQLQELAQTQIHWVGDAIQPAYPLCPVLLLPSVFSSVRVYSTNSSQQVAKVLALQLQRQSFQWIFRVYFL